VGNKIHSKKSPFANLANIIYERELVKILCLYYPSLDVLESKPLKKKQGLQSHIRIAKWEQNDGEELFLHLKAICMWLRMDFDSELELQRWGKARLPSGNQLRSRLSEKRGKAS
jgi:hypothetical protein